MMLMYFALYQKYEKKGLYVGSVVITQFAGQSGAVQFQKRLEKKGIDVYRHYLIVAIHQMFLLIVSPDGFGKTNMFRTNKTA